MSPDEMRIKLPLDELGTSSNKLRKNIHQRIEEDEQDIDHIDPSFISSIQITHTKGKFDIHIDYSTSPIPSDPAMEKINRNLLKALQNLF